MNGSGVDIHRLYAEPLMTSSDATAVKPRKLRRISRACDFCHRRSIRCKPSQDGSDRCQNCTDFDVDCTFDRPAKKRGTKGHAHTQSQGENGNSTTSGEHANLLLHLVKSHSGGADDHLGDHAERGKGRRQSLSRWRQSIEIWFCPTGKRFTILSASTLRSFIQCKLFQTYSRHE